MENTLNGEIGTKSVYISVNNNTNLKISTILSIDTIWDRLSQKTTVLLNGQSRDLDICLKACCISMLSMELSLETVA